MEITFDEIHKNVLGSMSNNPDMDENVLETIGQWYFKFLCSGRTDIRLSLPIHDPKIIRSTYLYLQNFSLIHSLLLLPQLESFEDATLFDFYNYKYNRGVGYKNNFLLKYQSQKNDLIVWGNDIMTDKKRFLPVFTSEQMSNVQFEKIKNSFRVFKAIRENRSINYPVLIDLSPVTLIITNGNRLTSPEYVNIFKVNNISTDTPEEEEEKAHLISQLNIDKQIVFRYPYHREIKQWYIRKDVKKLEISFNTRFFYESDDLMPSDVIILPSELNSEKTEHVINPNEYYLIFKTEHSHKISELLKELRSSWKQYDFNIYTSPFPKYWFLFVNPIVSVDDWISLFERNYPLVSQKPVMNVVREIINELHHLNWVKLFLESKKGTLNFNFPEIKGNKIKYLQAAYSYFQKYVKSLNPQISFNSELDQINPEESFYLNGFDILDTVNVLQTKKLNKQLYFLIPDFLYYTYNPWIIYQVFDYQKQAVCSEIRQELDSNFLRKKEAFEQIATKVRTSILSNIKSQQSSQSTSDVKLEGTDLNIEDLELNNDEENHIYSKADENADDYEIEISTNKTEIINLRSSNSVFAYRNSLISIKSNFLIIGDLFFTNADLDVLIGQSSFFDKLSEIPNSVKHFQYKLFKIPNVYKKLTNLGINYAAGESYFNRNYCLRLEQLSEQSFQLPRKRKYWKIICDFLGIESNEMSIAFISYYGRTRRNQIKALYKAIFSYLIDNNSIGKLENPDVLSEVSQIVNTYQEIFQQVEDFDLKEITKSILENISHELGSIIKVVKSIKTLKY